MARMKRWLVVTGAAKDYMATLTRGVFRRILVQDLFHSWDIAWEVW